MFPYRGIMLRKVVLPVLFALILKITLMNEDKERHFQKPLKLEVSYDTKPHTMRALHPGRHRVFNSFLYSALKETMA